MDILEDPTSADGLGTHNISTAAKCNAIPQHILFFCQQLYKHVSDKFPKRAQSVFSEFLFNRWLISDFCRDGNKNGLVYDGLISGVLRKNLSLVQESLTALLATKEDYEVMICDMPTQIQEVCQNLRSQAVRLSSHFIEASILDKTTMARPDSKFHKHDRRSLVKNDAVIASWSDISIIFDFFYI